MTYCSMIPGARTTVHQNNFDPNWTVCTATVQVYDDVKETVSFFSNTRAAMTAQLGHNFKVAKEAVVA